MNNRIGKILLVILVLTGARLLWFPTNRAKASPQEVFGACEAYVPEEWGEFVRGSEQSGVAFRTGKERFGLLPIFPAMELYQRLLS